MAPSRNSWSFSIHLYWDFSKSWSQIQKVGVNYSKFGVNETSALYLINKVVLTFNGRPLLLLIFFFWGGGDVLPAMMKRTKFNCSFISYLLLSIRHNI